jgi:hypothetical protein
MTVSVLPDGPVKNIAVEPWVKAKRIKHDIAFHAAELGFDSLDADNYDLAIVHDESTALFDMPKPGSHILLVPKREVTAKRDAVVFDSITHESENR